MTRHQNISQNADELAEARRSTVVPHRATLADKVSDERHRHFINRESELQAFGSALGNTSCSLLFVKGAAGTGKTSLLQACQRVASEGGHPARYVDAEELGRRGYDAPLTNPSLSLGRTPKAHPGARPVLLIDGYERLSGEQPWPLERLVHELPSDALLVLASRRAAPARLLLDHAWAAMTRQLELGPWNEAQAREFLERQGIPASVREGMLELGNGYPLALTIAASVCRAEGAQAFGARQLEAVYATLSRVLSFGAASLEQHLALDVCAVSRTVSVKVLDHVLDGSSVAAGHAHELFDWLAQRPFVDWAGDSVRLQRLPRITRLWRLKREQKYDALRSQIREFWVDRLSTTSAPEAGREALFFLDRDLPNAAGEDAWAEDDSELEAARPSDHAQVVELVRRHEGDDAAALCREHLELEPTAFELTRNGERADRVLHATRLTTAADLKLPEGDPVLRLVETFLRQHPPEKGACMVLVRWLMADDGYQSPLPQVLPLMARAAQIVMGAPRVTYALGVYRDPEEWQELWDAAGAQRQVIGRFTLGNGHYGLIAFGYLERSLRDQILDVRAPPSALARPSTAAPQDDQRRKIKLRVEDLARSARLTDRETEILELLCLGVAPEGIAHQLQIRPRTVKFHQENVLRKTGSASRVELFRRLI